MRSTVKFRLFPGEVLNVDARLALRVLWIAVLLAVLTSHLRALGDITAHKYAIWRAAPSLADLVRLACCHIVLITRLPPQDSDHAAEVPDIKGEEEATFAVSDGNGNVLGRFIQGLDQAH